MKDHLIDFKNMPWEHSAPGIRYKKYIKHKSRVRLIEFTHRFIEDDWCTKGHIGYVLKGSLKIIFNHKVIGYKAGDGFFIPEGRRNRHKVIVLKGKKALVVSIERA